MPKISIKIPRNIQIIFVAILMIMMLSTNYLPALAKITKNEADDNKNPWTPEDEGDHFPCGCEWWMFYVALELEDGTHWDASATFQYFWAEAENGTEVGSSVLLHYYFDRESKKNYDFSSFDKDEKYFAFKKNTVDLKYYNNTINGLYPNYTIHLEDDKKEFILDIKLDARSLPHWAIQEAADGYFPWGMGLARYGFIPRMNSSGNLTINGKKCAATGIGYFEHAWGNFTYSMKFSFSKVKEFIKNFQKIRQIAKWLISEHSIALPTSLMFTTDNIFGYDWAWAAFENGWSLHLGIFHIFDCIAEGPVPGELCLADGKTACDFGDIRIKYGKRLYIPEADAYLPLDIEVTATKGDKLLFLRFNSTTDPHKKSIGLYPLSSSSCGGAGIQTAGVVEGYYKDKDGKVSLNGVCTIGPWRQFSAKKHNAVNIEVKRLPNGLGRSLQIISHYRGFELFLKRQLLPYPDFRFYIKRSPNLLPVEPPQEPQFNDSNTCLYVGGIGQNNYTRIQDAVDNASCGDTVFVCNGTYVENIVVNKSIHLIGEDKNKVYLKAGNKDGIKVIANNVEIAGFTIDSEQADSYDDSAIDLSSSYNFVHHNNIIKSEWYGIFVFNSSYNFIENNSINDNDVGIWLCRASGNVIRYNNISHSNYCGLWLYPFSYGNNIYCNNFIGSKKNCLNPDRICRNDWDRNYYDDWIGLKFRRLADLNKDDIGNIPYCISRLNVDQHPVMNPYN